jgi:hypothetical protein
MGRATLEPPDGRRIAVRRGSAAGGVVCLAAEHVVRSGERLDTIAAPRRPEQFWRIADANALCSEQLTDEPGRRPHHARPACRESRRADRTCRDRHRQLTSSSTVAVRAPRVVMEALQSVEVTSSTGAKSVP